MNWNYRVRVQRTLVLWAPHQASHQFELAWVYDVCGKSGTKGSEAKRGPKRECGFDTTGRTAAKAGVIKDQAPPQPFV